MILYDFVICSDFFLIWLKGESQGMFQKPHLGINHDLSFKGGGMIRESRSP